LILLRKPPSRPGSRRASWSIGANATRTWSTVPPLGRTQRMPRRPRPAWNGDCRRRGPTSARRRARGRPPAMRGRYRPRRRAWWCTGAGSGPGSRRERPFRRSAGATAAQWWRRRARRGWRCSSCGRAAQPSASARYTPWPPRPQRRLTVCRDRGRVRPFSQGRAHGDVPEANRN